MAVDFSERLSYTLVNMSSGMKKVIHLGVRRCN